MSKSNAGRPAIVGDIVLQKLESAFSYGLTDTQACFEAGISTSTLYNYQEKNPEFVERKEALKDNPKVLAKKVVTDAIKEGDKQQANWYLERKDPEFVKKSEQKSETNLNIKGFSMEEAMQMTPEELERIANQQI